MGTSVHTLTLALAMAQKRRHGECPAVAAVRFGVGVHIIEGKEGAGLVWWASLWIHVCKVPSVAVSLARVCMLRRNGQILSVG